MKRILEITSGDRGFSLRTRVTILMVLVSLAIQISLGLVLLWYQERALARLFDARLEGRVQVVLSMMSERGFHATDEELIRIEQEAPRPILDERSFLTLYAPGGEVIASSLRPAPLPNRAAIAKALSDGGNVVSHEKVPEHKVEGDAGAWTRLAFRRLSDSNGRPMVVLVGTSDNYYRTVMGVTIRVLAIAILTGVVATGIAGTLISGLAMAPLRRLRLIAGSLAPSNGDGQAEDPDVQPTEYPSPSSKPMLWEFAILEKDLQEARAKLREAFAAQERFIANVSHELKTPIAVILTEAQTIPSGDLTPRAKKFTKSVTEEMKRLARMVESFLTLTKIRSGRTQVQSLPCSVNELVMEVVTGCHKMAAQYGVGLSPELAPAHAAFVVSGEFELLSVMLDNLVRNAVRFSPQHRDVVVAVRCEDKAFCTITVRDFGKGVPDEMIDKLFSRFVQAPQEAVTGRGHGLGLAIALGVAELHGGRISVRNLPPSEGGGCEFIAHLPLISANEQPRVLEMPVEV